jgi:hypothetical protein
MARRLVATGRCYLFAIALLLALHTRHTHAGGLCLGGAGYPTQIDVNLMYVVEAFGPRGGEDEPRVVTNGMQLFGGPATFFSRSRQFEVYPYFLSADNARISTQSFKDNYSYQFCSTQFAQSDPISFRTVIENNMDQTRGVFMGTVPAVAPSLQTWCVLCCVVLRCVVVVLCCVVLCCVVFVVLGCGVELCCV